MLLCGVLWSNVEVCAMGEVERATAVDDNMPSLFFKSPRFLVREAAR